MAFKIEESANKRLGFSNYIDILLGGYDLVLDPGFPSATAEHKAALASFPGEVDWAEFFNPEDFNVNQRNDDPDYSKLGLKFALIYRNHYEDEVGRWEDA